MFKWKKQKPQVADPPTAATLTFEQKRAEYLRLSKDPIAFMHRVGFDPAYEMQAAYFFAEGLLQGDISDEDLEELKNLERV